MGMEEAVTIKSVEWLNSTEAAQHLKIKPRTLVLWAREGKIPSHRLSGNHRVTWRFLRHELDAMLNPSSAVPAEWRQH
jgi:excisionase family DNA binding protein